MCTRAVVPLESLGGVYACEFGVLPLWCIITSPDLVLAWNRTHMTCSIPKYHVLTLSGENLYQGLYCLVYVGL